MGWPAWLLAKVLYLNSMYVYIQLTFIFRLFFPTSRWCKLLLNFDIFFQVSSIYLGNYAGTLWEIVSANSHREVKFYKGIDSPWPAIRVHLVLRRISFVDRKITVLPLVCKFVDIIIKCSRMIKVIWVSRESQIWWCSFII